MPKIVASKEDWINEGFKLFSRKGISGLVVEQMAKSLSCNKSSFYWHFKTKDSFIDAIVELWTYTDTQLIIDLANAQEDINDKYHRFVKMVFQKDPFLDFVFYLKRYSVKHPHIQSKIDQVDDQRLTFLIDMLEEMGLTAQDAVIKAPIFYKYMIGFHETYRYKEMEAGYLNNVKRDLELILQL